MSQGHIAEPSPSVESVAEYLAEHEQATQSEVARHFGVSRSVVRNRLKDVVALDETATWPSSGPPGSRRRDCHQAEGFDVAELGAAGHQVEGHDVGIAARSSTPPGRGLRRGRARSRRLERHDPTGARRQVEGFDVAELGAARSRATTSGSPPRPAARGQRPTGRPGPAPARPPPSRRGPRRRVRRHDRPPGASARRRLERHDPARSSTPIRSRASTWPSSGPPPAARPCSEIPGFPRSMAESRISTIQGRIPGFPRFRVESQDSHDSSVKSRATTPGSPPCSRPPSRRGLRRGRSRSRRLKRHDPPGARRQVVGFDVAELGAARSRATSPRLLRSAPIGMEVDPSFHLDWQRSG